MLNDILAVCVAAAVVAVIATILGAVELVRRYYCRPMSACRFAG